MANIDCRGKTDEELVALSLDNSDFFGCLVERYELPLRRYCRRLVGRRDDEDDLLQDILLKGYLNLNDFDQDLKFSSWIYRIAHNRLVDYLRSGRHSEFYGEEAEKFLKNFNSGENSSSLAELREAKEFVEKTLYQLDAKSQEILILRFFEDKSYEEISDILKIPPGTVAARLNRAKNKFKKIANQKT